MKKIKIVQTKKIKLLLSACSAAMIIMSPMISSASAMNRNIKNVVKEENIRTNKNLENKALCCHCQHYANSNNPNDAFFDNQSQLPKKKGTAEIH